MLISYKRALILKDIHKKIFIYNGVKRIVKNKITGLSKNIPISAAKQLTGGSPHLPDEP